MKIKQGFTLIELLVVVLIIGILSAIALPQYQKAVEKAHTAELLMNIKAIKDTYNLFILENGGYPSQVTWIEDMGGEVDLTGGTWDTEQQGAYTTKYFEYFSMYCSPSKFCYAEISAMPDYKYTIILGNHNGGEDACLTQNTDIGRYICKSLESLGFTYYDEEF